MTKTVLGLILTLTAFTSSFGVGCNSNRDESEKTEPAIKEIDVPQTIMDTSAKIFTLCGDDLVTVSPDHFIYLEAIVDIHKSKVPKGTLYYSENSVRLYCPTEPKWADAEWQNPPLDRILTELKEAEVMGKSLRATLKCKIVPFGAPYPTSIEESPGVLATECSIIKFEKVEKVKFPDYQPRHTK